MNLSTKVVQLVFVTSVQLMSWCAHDTVLSACFRFRFIDTRVLDPARHLAFITPLVWEFLTFLNSHVQMSELGACGLPGY